MGNLWESNGSISTDTGSQVRWQGNRHGLLPGLCAQDTKWLQRRGGAVRLAGE